MSFDIFSPDSEASNLQVSNRILLENDVIIFFLPISPTDDVHDSVELVPEVLGDAHLLEVDVHERRVLHGAAKGLELGVSPWRRGENRGEKICQFECQSLVSPPKKFRKIPNVEQLETRPSVVNSLFPSLPILT